MAAWWLAAWWGAVAARPRCKRRRLHLARAAARAERWDMVAARWADGGIGEL